MRSLADARRWLAAPFPGVCVGYLPNKLGPNSQWAAVFPYVDVTAIQDRLDLVAGPDGWSHSVAAVDDTTLVVTMRVLGTEHSEVGQGNDRWSQSANALKRCARHFGIGRYLTQLPIVRLKLGEQIPVNRNGSPYITDQLLEQLRGTYERQVNQLEGRFGAVLPHPGIGAGEHEGEAPTHPEVDPDAGSPSDANPHGARVREEANARGLQDAQLANLILAAAGGQHKPPEQAAAQLGEMLRRMPETIAQRALASIAELPTVGPDSAMSGAAPQPNAPATTGEADGQTVQANATGERLRQTAAARGVSDADLANTIRNAAGQDSIPSERARAALPAMLARISDQIGERAMELLDMFHPADGARPEGASGAVTSVDFGALEPPRAA
ncbi:MAG: hypothetical protein JO168_10840 [Solirubrobacterales bacterium]|nr:hypothetical protein [Solirubrobacterales bacterium]